MKHIASVALVVLGLVVGITVAEEGESKSAAANEKSPGVKDPRFGLAPVILYRNQKERSDTFTNPLLIFARHDTDPPNQIIGVEGSFTNDQIVAGLREFYRSWRPEAGGSRIPPQLIFAQQNWGSGAGLHKPLEKLSREYKFDVYLLYAIVTQIATTVDHPTAADRALADLIDKAE